MSGYLYFVRYCTKYVTIACEQGCDIIYFEIILIILIEPFFLHDQKAKTISWQYQTMKYLENEKSL